MGQRYSRTPLFSAMGHYLYNLLKRLVRQSKIYPEMRMFGLLTHSRPAVAHIESPKTLISKNKKIVLKIFEFKKSNDGYRKLCLFCIVDDNMDTIGQLIKSQLRVIFSDIAGF